MFLGPLLITQVHLTFLGTWLSTWSRQMYLVKTLPGSDFKWWDLAWLTKQSRWGVSKEWSGSYRQQPGKVIVKLWKIYYGHWKCEEEKINMGIISAAAAGKVKPELFGRFGRFWSASHLSFLCFARKIDPIEEEKRGFKINPNVLQAFLCQNQMT